LKKLFNSYLWSGFDQAVHKAKVSWKQVCLPKSEGGLGLKRITDWNRSTVTSHIWNLLIQAGSLWVAWVHKYLLKGKNLREVKIPQNCSWSCSQILKLRDL